MNSYSLKLFFTLTCCLFFSCSASTSNELIEGVTPPNFETEILLLINKHRKSKGLQELQILEVIKSQTDSHTNYMIQQNALSHDNFNTRADYLKKHANSIGIAENVAKGYSTAETVVNGWLKSDGHRQNIEGNYTHFNLTAKQNKNGVWYYTNIFVRVQ